MQIQNFEMFGKWIITPSWLWTLLQILSTCLHIFFFSFFHLICMSWVASGSNETCRYFSNYVAWILFVYLYNNWRQSLGDCIYSHFVLLLLPLNLDFVFTPGRQDKVIRNECGTVQHLDDTTTSKTVALTKEMVFCYVASSSSICCL